MGLDDQLIDGVSIWNYLQDSGVQGQAWRMDHAEFLLKNSIENDVIRGIKEVMESVDSMCNNNNNNNNNLNYVDAPLEYGRRHFLGNLANDSSVYLSDDLSSSQEESDDDDEESDVDNKSSKSHRRRQSNSLMSFVSDSIDFIACF
jgi:hypothetical protein